jgi:pyruvate dehydrogenase E2 component (dihydrolipoamide acetyltransferase)
LASKVMIPNTGGKETSGTIGMWFKGEGEPVKEGEPLCTIETEKASVEIEAPCSGILRRIIAPRDAVVSVGECIAIIGDPDEDISALEEELARK